MKSTFKNLDNIRSTSNLTIVRLNEKCLIAWSPNYLWVSVPKLILELNDDRKTLNVKTIGFFKGLFLNFLIFFALTSLVLYFPDNDLELVMSSYPLFLGTFVFLTLLNYLVVFSTRWKVEQQLNKSNRQEEI